MQNIHQLPEMKLVGLSIRTNNEIEFTPGSSRIANIISRYWSENIANQIPERKNPGVTIAGYTDYASDEHGDYTYFFGEEVESLVQVPKNLRSFIVPKGDYVKFTTPKGKMIDVVVGTWKDIWQMTAKDLGKPRNYQFDFEIYDSRAADPSDCIVDIYIGLTP